SMIISLTTTTMMCATMLKPQHERKHGRLFQASESVFRGMLRLYERTLTRILHHPAITLSVTLTTIFLSVYLYVIVPRGFFPQQDTGRLNGTIKADQKTSFQAMNAILRRSMAIVAEDPAVDQGLLGFTGGFQNSVNSGTMFINLKPLNQRPNR